MALSLSPAARHQLTNLLTAFSLGTLCFIRRWYDLENLQARGLDYFRSAPPDYTLLISTIVAALILASGFWLAWFWVERHPTPGRRKFGHCVFLLVLIFPIESVRRYWNGQTDGFDWGSNLSLWVIEILLAAGLIALLFGYARIMRPARRVVVMLMLLFPALMIDFLLNRLGGEQANLYDPQPSLALLPARSGQAPRLIWIIFDELDQRVAFDIRPAHLQLPELDRLRAESVVGNHATQTSMWTAVALPSLISGRVYTNARAVDVDDLDLLPEGSKERVLWRNEENVFTRARQLGANAALVGWNHPYCRVMGNELVRCLALPSTHSTAALAQEARAEKDGVVRTVATLFYRQFLNLADMVHSGQEPASERIRDTDVQRDQQQQYFRIRDRAYQDAADPNIGLLFVHFPAPHLFPIYNRREKNFELRGPLDYFDNLALVDRTVGELRRTLEQAGLWNQTTLLITADHGVRPGNWAGHMGWTPEMDRLTGGRAPLYVPFILKLGGQAQPLVVEKTFSNVVSADLSLAILRGDISTPVQAEEWLNHRSVNPEASALAGAENAR